MRIIGKMVRLGLIRRLLGAFFLLAVLPALACNFPRAGDDSLQWLPSRTPAGESSAEPPLPPGEATPESSPLPPPEVTETPLIPTITPRARTWEFPGLQRFDPSASGLPDETVLHPPRVWNYETQPGDTRASLAARFGVNELQLGGLETMGDGFIPAGTPISVIMDEVRSFPAWALLPDSEIPYGPSAADFDLRGYIAEQGGILSRHSEEVENQLLSGAEIVERVALDTSTNPRLLLAFLEQRSGWVRNAPKTTAEDPYPLGFSSDAYRGLYGELILTARYLSQGLYGWRSGRLVEADFPGGGKLRIDPRVNAGTAAATILITRMFRQATYRPALYGPEGFIATYWDMFGDPWERAAPFEPMFTENFAGRQPLLELPFRAGERWNMTSGPHIAWGSASPFGALDFAPSGERSGCYVSTRWTTAAAAGLVVRSERGMVFLDLDGDGFEQTGMVLLYLHIAGEERVPTGTWLEVDEPLGHPSCEGGRATGTHVHFARKYNGEWLRIGPETPLVLGEWSAFSGESQYLGGLMSPDGRVVTARSDGSHTSLITR